MRIKVQHCRDADIEHEVSKRQYAHTLHKTGVICVARAFFDLPETNRLGILLHEVGHILHGSRHHSEADANKRVKKFSGVQVYYRDGVGGPDLEWIEPKDKQKAREFLGL